MSDFAHGERAMWTSNKGHVREVRIVTAMKSSPDHRVEITGGLPGEAGTFRTLPTRLLRKV